LVLCDEPTGNLDTATSHQILDLLHHLHQAGQTVVIVTHDPDIAAGAQRHLSITDGILTDITHPANV
jgi:putative ABC transport system ATP-binding protein